MIFKKTAIILLILIVSCTRNSTDDKKINQGLTSKEVIAEKLDGYWLSESYLLDISRSHSIYHSREYKTKFWGFVLDRKNLMTDSASINGFTPHEAGYSCFITFDSVKNGFVNDLSKSDQYSFVEEAFSLTLLDNEHLQLDFQGKKDVYRKVTDDQTETRKILFQGRFKDLKANNVIEFSADGNVSGFNNHQYFELASDFNEGMYYDVGIFYPHRDSSTLWTKGELFNFKINADTIKLYRITPDWVGLDHKIGDLEYLLVKL
jgi:hypothetical protein